MLTDTFCRLQEKLHRVAVQLLKDEMEADDAVQDAFCNLWVADIPASDDEARFRLFAVLKNVCLNKLKRKRPVLELESLEIAMESSDGSDSERLKNELLRHLTPLQRKIFVLSVEEDMDYEEIAGVMGMNVEAVRTNMCRARKILREQYKRLNYGS